MSQEIPLEIPQLHERLLNDFKGRLPDAASGSEEEREKNFLSRALAAFAIHRLSGCTLDEASQAVVDGGGDGGIDAIYYAPTSRYLWVAQSKFISNGRVEPPLAEVIKFKIGLENLLQGRFDAFDKNAFWKAKIPGLQNSFEDSSLQVRAVLVYSGVNVVSDDRLRLFEDLKARFSPGEDYFTFLPCGLTTVGDWLTDADQEPGVAEVSLILRKPGWLKNPHPYETIYGLLPLADLNALFQSHGKKLVAANIREYKGETEVNEQILKTLRDEPGHFFYLNNGLTAYCTRLEVAHLDRVDVEQKRVRAFNFSIVNGAQTLGAVTKFFNTAETPALDGFVFLKIISLERCEEEGFAQRITHSTNFQNQIGARDFVALDAQQERIRAQLQPSGVNYHYKDGDDAEEDENNFTLREATRALACLEQDASCDLYARALANPKSLWSEEAVYPETEILRSRYARIFRPDRAARTVWRAVQAQRLVVEKMRDEGRSSAGLRKTFFENARWLVFNILLLQLRPERGNELALSHEENAAVVAKTLEIAEALWQVCEENGYVSEARHFRSVFSSATDCQGLRNAILAKLA
ncbi:MAG: AIPR family protein [Acidobacteria bacterium]|nr:AIPR family protein [Acidobacteriota bacterium]